MRILFLSQYFHPEQFLNNHIARELVQRGHEVDVVCCVPNYPAGNFFPGYSNRLRKVETWHGVRIFRVTTVPRGRRKYQLALNYFLYPLSAGWRIWRLRRRNYDVSFVSMPSPLFQGLAGIFAKWLRCIPTVFWVQDIWPDSAIVTLKLRNRAVVTPLSALCGWIYRRADLLLLQNQGFANAILPFGVARSRIATLPNTAPLGFEPIATADISVSIRQSIPQDRKIVMFAGNIGESQDFETIIEAAALLPITSPILIVVVGSGRDERRVRQSIIARGLDDRFLFLGRHAEASMPDFFACADAMLVSLRDEPVFSATIPSKVQSYLACGKPIVASLAGEGAKVIRDAQAGIVVPPSHPQKLSEAFGALAALSNETLAELGRAARATYLARFSLEAVVTELERHLEGVMHPGDDHNRLRTPVKASVR